MYVLQKEMVSLNGLDFSNQYVGQKYGCRKKLCQNDTNKVLQCFSQTSLLKMFGKSENSLVTAWLYNIYRWIYCITHVRILWVWQICFCLQCHNAVNIGSSWRSIRKPSSKLLAICWLRSEHVLLFESSGCMSVVSARKFSQSKVVGLLYVGLIPLMIYKSKLWLTQIHSQPLYRNPCSTKLVSMLETFANSLKAKYTTLL